ncbi:MAG: carboxylate--amine ligase [Clostridiales bacterium]|nr:carboxylate--amine ligase [Clostridiales bacterium]
MTKLMILGAGNCQLNAIKRIKSLGYDVVVSDNRIDSPGKALADISVLADTFSYEASFVEAKKHGIHGIMTSGTDQPVYTVSKIAEAMKLNTFLSPETAFLVTNKKAMKEQFTRSDIKTAPYAFIKQSFKDEELNFEPPYVVKPLDSQGQRGIFKLYSKEDVRVHFDEVIKYSALDEIIVESFYENKEVTVNGWVSGGKVTVLAITDRVTFHSDEHIGVCIAHEYPSIHLERYEKDIMEMTYQICSGFEINEGPIYFQYLVGSDGVYVNEIACRIGGAYEDITIPYVTGVDILDMVIEGSLKEAYDTSVLNQYVYDTKQVYSTQLYFCKPGKVTDITDLNEMKSLDCILDIACHYEIGDTIGLTENASQRAGYIIITGEDELDLRRNIEMVYDQFKVMDDTENLLIRGKRYYR